MKTLSLFFVVFCCCAIAGAQDSPNPAGLYKSVIPGWKGWDGNPDSVTVRIMPGPPEFSSEDSAAIVQAIDAWNGTDSKPKLKLISSGEPQIGIIRNDTLSGAVGTAKPDPDWENPESFDVQIDTDDGQTTLSTAMHELGHCLGLDDTANAGDVMYGDSDVECAESFSGGDSTEVRDAVAAIDASDGVRDPELPEKAMMPGEATMLIFAVGDLVPPDQFDQTGCFVESLDPLIYVEGFFLDSMTQSLVVNVFSDPAHTNGQFYLFTFLMVPEKRGPVTFLGRHFINLNPVPPVIFECPMTVYEMDGFVHVNWMADCTYPFGGKLRSRLLVEHQSGSFGVDIRPDGDFILELDPGTYTFTLFVDDFQVNSASSSLDYFVTGMESNFSQAAINLRPNPFTGSCSIELDKKGRVSIFDLNGKNVFETEGKFVIWTPFEAVGPGVYIVRVVTEEGVSVSKVVYQR
jgi:hypothetical protein